MQRAPIGRSLLLKREQNDGFPGSRKALPAAPDKGSGPPSAPNTMPGAVRGQAPPRFDLRSASLATAKPKEPRA